MKTHPISYLLKKAAQLSLALSMGILCLTGCESSGNDSENVSESQLPYGATITVNTKNEISVQHDRRFLDETLVEKLSDFYYSIQTQDVALFQSVQLPLYHDYMLSELNGGKFTDADILSLAYQSDMIDPNNKDIIYDFAMIDVIDAKKGTVYSKSANVISTLDALCLEQGIPKVTADIDSVYELSVARFLTEQGSGVRRETGVMLTEEEIIALRYQGQWYIIYD